MSCGRPSMPFWVSRKSFNKDELFDATNAAAALPTRQY